MLEKPLLYGTISTPTQGTEHTHKWTAYVRGWNNEDISYYVKKVSFKLHESFTDPLRTVTEWPFEISETGWGEFEIQIKIYLLDSRILTVNHFLRLHFEPSLKMVQDSVLSEKYDEVVFDENSPFADILLEHPESEINVKDPRYKEFNELIKSDLSEIERAQNEIDAEIQEYEGMIQELENKQNYLDQ